MQNENKKGFQVRDLIVTALLSVCALVIYILCAFLSFSPYTMLVVSPLWALLAAITYFLVAAKTKKPWALFIFLCSNRDLWFLSTYDNLLYYCRDYFCADCLENRLYEWKDTYNQLYYLHGFSSIQWNIYSFPVFLKTNA